MVNWKSDAEIAKDALVFSRFMHVLLGVYMYLFFAPSLANSPNLFRQMGMVHVVAFRLGIPVGQAQVSLADDILLLESLLFTHSLDWNLGRFECYHVLYCRFPSHPRAHMLPSQIDCQSLYTFNSLFGNAAIGDTGLASINLSLRTIAVWNQQWYIWVPLICVILGHWSLLLHGVFLKAEWKPELGGCQITSTDNRLLAITFIYSMVFDLTVLFLTAWKLVFPTGGRSPLVNLIFNDGLIYFVIAFLSNLLATFGSCRFSCFSTLTPLCPLSPMSPQQLLRRQIVACRAVRRLANYGQTGAQMFGGHTTASSTLAFKNSNGLGTTQRPKVVTNMKASEGVHVQMETFESPTTAVDSHSHSYLEFDETGKLTRSPPDDLEAQIPADEFKRPEY
ncbi:hypothetical protein MIND_00510300 [Mycena indigotica]|uniref:Uncharacterized protein n=1 Tax=Mycena indigotica TaxID=2126181 RepID=A0A8H6SZI2_9AGAR|nr:uncharacterized protein MIND_00510300 [Mycena indigotica]KAF7307167.1 hypothetical protein MIND_00510300 [Mycena indigotica]